MKKTLSILFAVIIAMSALVSAGAIGLVNENNLQSNIASYMGYDESKMQDFKAEKITRNALDYYEVTFKYDGVGYHVGVNALGLVDTYSYNAKKVIIPKAEKNACVSELNAKGYALKEANTASSDAIFKAESFSKKDGVCYYYYDFLGTSAEWEVYVNAYTGSIASSSHEDQNAFIMFFIRLFAKIAALFSF